MTGTVVAVSTAHFHNRGALFVVDSSFIEEQSMHKKSRGLIRSHNRCLESRTSTKFCDTESFVCAEYNEEC